MAKIQDSRSPKGGLLLATGGMVSRHFGPDLASRGRILICHGGVGRRIMTSVEVRFTIDYDTAWELAQFAKRLGFQACYGLTEAHLDGEERRDRAYRMIHGIDQLAAALSRAGIAPN